MMVRTAVRTVPVTRQPDRASTAVYSPGVRSRRPMSASMETSMSVASDRDAELDRTSRG